MFASPGLVSAATQPTTHVLATTFEGTSAALNAAVPMNRGSGARLVVLVPQIVPYPLPIDAPAEPASFTAERYRNLLHQHHAEAEVRICLCRHADDVLFQQLPSHATVVVGGTAGTWFATKEERLACRLNRLGHRVVFAPIEERASETVAERPVAPTYGIFDVRSMGPLVVLAAVLTLGMTPRAALAQAPTNGELLRRIALLEAQLAELKDLVAAQGAKVDAPKVEDGKSEQAKAEESVFLDYLHDLKYAGSLDTYYGYNFNRPVGRVNLLRAYDVTSNNFALNQASVVLESAPDIQAGRRFGARLDLQYGQATETLQGSLSNEPRPWVYRNIFQAYGTYVFPLGSGLSVDFGKWASSIGLESNYSKDQANYSRSYWFDYLPFYHMGARVVYRFNDAIAANYWITNGTQQTEAFNNYKDQMFGAVVNPVKSVTWTTNFYMGQEHPDVEPVQAPGVPTIPTQPGLSITPIVPALDGRLHIFDSYATWQAAPKTSISLEGDYVVSRAWNEPGPGRDTTPSHVYGGALYARQQVTPKAALAARAEYLRDDGGLFSGTTQTLNEVTLTYEYKVAEGFLMRGEWRRDASNMPFFLTRDAGVLMTDQNTATLGVIWWWGTKRGAW
jgi:hypothetical protein